MNYLFIIRRFSIGGSQINLLAIINELTKRNNNVFLLSDKGVLIDKLPKCVIWHYYPFVSKFHPHLNFILKVNRIVKENTIDFIFSIDPIMSIETQLTYIFHKKRIFSIITAQNIPYIYPKSWSTIFVNENRMNFYKEKFKLVEAHYIKERLDINKFKYLNKKNQKKKVVGLISRLDPIKENSIIKTLDFFNYLDKSRGGDFEFIIAGTGSLFESLKKQYNNFNFKFLGEVIEIENVFSKLDIVFGMASTILQGMATNTISVVVGDKGIVGVVNLKTIEEFSFNHFNIHNDSRISFTELETQLDYYLLNKSELDFYYDYIHNNYSVSIGVDKIESLTKSSYKPGSFIESLVIVLKTKCKNLINRFIK